MATVAVSHLLPRDLPTKPWLKPLPEALRRNLGNLWPQFLDGLETMRSARLLTKAVALNFAGWWSQVLMFWLFGLAFDLELSFSAYVVIMIAANLVVAVPFQNIGTYEVVLLEILAAWGVARQEAFAYAAATHLLTNFWVVATGLLALWLMRISPREVFALRRASTGAEPQVPQKTRSFSR